jgi:hypothetical protein
MILWKMGVARELKRELVPYVAPKVREPRGLSGARNFSLAVY